MGGQKDWLGPSLGYDLFNQLHNPFLSCLDLPYLDKLTSDPIRYDPYWPPMLAKFPFEFPNSKEVLKRICPLISLHIICDVIPTVLEMIRLSFSCSNILLLGMLQNGTLNWIPNHTMTSLF